MFVAKKNCREKGKSRFGVGYIVGMLFLQKKKNLQQKKFLEDFATFAKGFMPIFVVKIQWLKCLIMHQNFRNVFPNHKQMVQHAIPTFVVETMDHYVMPTLNYFVTTIIISFEWWMFNLNMIHLVLWLISSIHIEYLAMWQWDCLKPLIQLQLQRMWRIYFHLIFYVTNWLHMWWTRVEIYEGDKLFTETLAI